MNVSAQSIWLIFVYWFSMISEFDPIRRGRGRSLKGTFLTCERNFSGLRLDIPWKRPLFKLIKESHKRFQAPDFGVFSTFLCRFSLMDSLLKDKWLTVRKKLCSKVNYMEEVDGHDCQRLWIIDSCGEAQVYQRALQGSHLNLGKESLISQSPAQLEWEMKWRGRVYHPSARSE